jgi:hypothetical protein
MSHPFPRSPKPACFALGRMKPGLMNKTEASYANFLEGQRQAGTLAWWAFEPLKLRLSDGCFYTPDFCVLRADMGLELHEIKGGFWQDDAKVKFKLAREHFPAVFRAFRKVKGVWVEESF